MLKEKAERLLRFLRGRPGDRLVLELPWVNPAEPSLTKWVEVYGWAEHPVTPEQEERALTYGWMSVKPGIVGSWMLMSAGSGRGTPAEEAVIVRKASGPADVEEAMAQVVRDARKAGLGASRPPPIRYMN